MVNNGARFLLNIDLEAAVDGVWYKSDDGQTMFIDKSWRLDKFLSTVTSTTVISPIPGTTATGKGDSLSARLGSPLVAILLVGAAMYVLLWGGGGMVIYLSRNAPTFHDRFPALDAYSRIAQSGEVCSKLGDCVYFFRKVWGTPLLGTFKRWMPWTISKRLSFIMHSFSLYFVSSLSSGKWFQCPIHIYVV